MTAFDLPRFLAELDEWTEEWAWPVRTIAYGGHPDQEGDLRLPEGEGPHPVAVVLHGGFWRAAYTRSTTAPLAVDLARRGWATWNLEYRRLDTGGGVPETLEDMIAGVARLDELAEPLDLDRIVALGHSAGGQLALWLAATGAVAAAVSLGGVCDLEEAAELGIGDAAARAFVGGRGEAYDLADPLRRLPAGVPQVVAHGTEDDRVPAELSRRYAAAARAAGDRCELVELPGVGHFELIDPRSAAWRTVLASFPAL